LLDVCVLLAHDGQKLVDYGIQVESVLVLEQKQDEIATSELHHANEENEPDARLVKRKHRLVELVIG
jgi:hypothetical protein